MSSEVLSRIDKECDAQRGVFVYTKSRSTVIENYVRDAYHMPRIDFGRKKKPIANPMDYLTDPVDEKKTREPEPGINPPPPIPPAAQ